LGFIKGEIRFSLRGKVLSVFILTVSVVLFMSNYLYYLSSKNILEQDAIAKNEALTREISTQIEISEQGSQFVDKLIGNNLRVASLVAKYALSPDSAKVTNQQLVALSKEIGINQITLLQPIKGNIIGIRSSDPKEVNLSTKGWGLWYRAFRFLSSQHNVPSTLNYGKSEANYWTGPPSNAASDPSLVDKWGYFDDGTTNYIIDPYVRDTIYKSYDALTGPDAITKSILNANDKIREITAFNPRTFGRTPILYNADGATWVDISNEPILFGTYKYSDKNRDLPSVREAAHTDSTINFKDVVSGRTVLKTFIPMKTGSVSYVVGIVTDYAVIQSVLDKQIRDRILISLILLFFVSIVSYLASNYILRPLSTITRKVEQISEINFWGSVPIHRRDEIGELAAKVNDMSQNLSEYMWGLNESLRHERSFSMSFLGMVSSGLIHELRNPSVALKNLLELFPSAGLDEQSQEMVHHMKLSSNHLNGIVNDFAGFIRSGKLNLEVWNAADIAREAVDFIGSTALMRSIEVRDSIPPIEAPVFVDREKLRQVLVNLLKNGIDAIDEGVPRKVVQLDMQSDGKTVQIYVTDSGHGIPESRWETIFTPFSTTKEGELGLGLGLALSKFIILSSGGVYAHIG